MVWLRCAPREGAGRAERGRRPTAGLRRHRATRPYLSIYLSIYLYLSTQTGCPWWCAFLYLSISKLDVSSSPAPLMNKFVVAALLLLVRGSESLTLQRRALFKAAVAAASVTAAVAQVSPARASEIDWQALGVPVERLNQPEPGRPPNPQASGPLANTPFGFQVGGGPRPEEEVRKIDEARYRAAGRSPLDSVPRAGPSFLEDGATEPPPERR